MQDDPLPEHPTHARPAHAALGPWWYTLLVVAVMLAISVVTRYAPARSASPDNVSSWMLGHLPGYAMQILFTWMLFGAVMAGIYRRRGFLRAAFQRRWHGWGQELTLALTVYLLCAVCAGVGIVTWHRVDTALHPHATTTQLSAKTDAQADNSADTPQDAPQTDAKPRQQGREPLFRRNEIARIAPRNSAELLVWFLLSITAGVCEELMFRGYLLGQFLHWFGARHGFNMRSALAVMLSAGIFGAVHLYQGFGGVALVTMLGVVYGAVVMWRGNLRAVMLAHTLQDFLAGWILMAKHLHH